MLGLTKFWPVKVIVRFPEPTAMEFGLMLVSVGAGGGGGGGCVIVNVRALDVPEVFWTVTLAVPALARSPEGIIAVKLAELTNVVAIVLPAKTMDVGFTNPVPVRVTGRLPLPACADEGLTLESVGAGGGGGAVMVKVMAPLVPLAF